MPFISNAYASAATGVQSPDLLMTLALIFVIFVLFWFLLVRPQQKQLKEHQAMVNAIAPGDEIVTQGGIAGRVRKVGEKFIHVEVANNVEIQIQRNAIAAKLDKGTFKAL